MIAERAPWIVRVMCEPSLYDHPVAEVTLIETHISWVFLAGDFAYKVKKPLDLGFLDFSTLSKRHHYCQQELRLNRNFSPTLYLALTAVGGCRDKPAINGEPILEYAVKMRRFPQECQLDRMLAASKLQAQHIIAFAEKIASLHQQAAVADPVSTYGSVTSVVTPVLENFDQMKPLLDGDAGKNQLASLEQWSRQACEELKPFIQQRKDEAFIRACHGDVHLANMAWFEEQPMLFDCIEFDENLRWIDVINDIAFLVMDLDDRKQSPLGWRFLNRYLQQTGDYQGLALLNFYKAYRAMVRAKIISIRLAQTRLDNSQRQQTENLLHSYLDLAELYTCTHKPPLIITHGKSGAGKSTFSMQLAYLFGAIHLRSDIERKRLHGIAATAGSESPIAGGIYSPDAFAETYNRLLSLADVSLRAGLPVIVDATFLKKPQRELFHELARELKVPCVLLDFPLSEKELRLRLEERALADHPGPSEAGVDVLDYQLKHEEPLTADEKRASIKVEPNTCVEAVIRLLTS